MITFDNEDDLSDAEYKRLLLDESYFDEEFYKKLDKDLKFDNIEIEDDKEENG